MENPKCPYCGEEMIPVAYGTTSLKRMNADWVSHNRSEQDTRYCFQCSICESESPLADTYEAAYAAAMKREKKRKTYFEDFLQKHPKADMLHNATHNSTYRARCPESVQGNYLWRNNELPRFGMHRLLERGNGGMG